MANNKVTLKDVYELIGQLREDIKETYVTKAEFNPVKACVYGFIGLILTSIVVALIAQVVKAR